VTSLLPSLLIAGALSPPGEAPTFPVAIYDAQLRRCRGRSYPPTRPITMKTGEPLHLLGARSQGGKVPACESHHTSFQIEHREGGVGRDVEDDAVARIDDDRVADFHLPAKFGSRVASGSPAGRLLQAGRPSDLPVCGPLPWQRLLRPDALRSPRGSQ